ncbi:MAG TPA: hypothetical protein VGM41_04510 [Chitinophagaceae bacterium]
MKHTKSAVFLSLLFMGSCLFFACNKSSDNPATGGGTGTPTDTIAKAPGLSSLLLGKWMLVEDSVANVGSFYFTQGGIKYYPTPGIYMGGSADYINFLTDTTVTVTENGQTYNSAYKLYGSSKLVINTLLVYDTGRVVTLTANNATLDWSSSSANGGTYYKRVYLTK